MCCCKAVVRKDRLWVPWEGPQLNCWVWGRNPDGEGWWWWCENQRELWSSLLWKWFLWTLDGLFSALRLQHRKWSPGRGQGLKSAALSKRHRGGLLNCFWLIHGKAAPSACTDGGRRVEGLGSHFSLWSLSSRASIWLTSVPGYGKMYFTVWFYVLVCSDFPNGSYFVTG